jgi:acetoin utilization deacetylase AcuC-like enzyme
VKDAEYLSALDAVLAEVRSREVLGLVVSLGVDTYRDDPISDLGLTLDAYFPMGRLLGELGVPTVVVQEGGYDLSELGVNVRSFLRGVGGLEPPSGSSGADR